MIASKFLPNEAATDQLAQIIAARMTAGDVLLLSGPIGAGKTHFARAVIRARLGTDTEVPSPTFTLVQTYEGEDIEIWHADLYRLSHPDEINELGLEAAFSSAACLVEWPDRLGDLVPEGALRLTFEAKDAGRLVSFTPSNHALLAGIA